MDEILLFLGHGNTPASDAFVQHGFGKNGVSCATFKSCTSIKL
jgi:hypothetical protein